MFWEAVRQMMSIFHGATMQFLSSLTERSHPSLNEREEEPRF